MPSATFYTGFSKRANSTKRPGGGATYNCNIIEPCDYFHPTIKLNISGNLRHATYFSMDGWYYYVTSAVYNPPCWEITGSIDPLATWKGDITAHTDFIIRCADSTVPQVFEDPHCIAQSTVMSADTRTTEIPAFGTSGGYIVTVGGLNAGAGSSYWCSSTDLVHLINAINSMTSHATWKDNMGAPMDYVRDIRFVPKSHGDGTPLTSIYVGSVQTTEPIGDNVQKAPAVANPGVWFSEYFNAHPQASDIGTWLNESPYSNRRITHPLLGDVPVNNLRSRVTCNYYIDNITGDAVFTVVSSDGIVLANRTANISTSTMVGGMTYPTQGTVLANTLPMVSGLVNVAMGNVASGAMQIVGGAINASQNCAPTFVSMGSNGSQNMLTVTGKKTEQFTRVVKPDYADTGKPYMQISSVGSHSGFVQVAHGDVNTSAPEPYKTEIANTMKGGIFIE